MTYQVDKSKCQACAYAKESLYDWPHTTTSKVAKMATGSFERLFPLSGGAVLDDYPAVCPKCQGRAILRERDADSSLATCLYCGWYREVVR